MGWFRFLAWIPWLLASCATQPPAPAAAPGPRHADPVGALARCRDAFGELARSATPLYAVNIAGACADLYVEAGCRDAMRASESTPPERRATTLTRACRSAYCPILPAPKPALCAMDLDTTPPTALTEPWADFNAAVLAFDLGIPVGESARAHSLARMLFRSVEIQVPVMARRAAPAESPPLRIAVRGGGGRLSLRLELPGGGTRELGFPAKVVAGC